MNLWMLILAMVTGGNSYADKLKLPKLELGPECTDPMGSPNVKKEPPRPDGTRRRIVRQQCANNGAVNGTGCFQGYLEFELEYPGGARDNPKVVSRTFHKFADLYDCAKLAQCRSIMNDPKATSAQQGDCRNLLLNFANTSRGGAGAD